ncbi:hypothetical protein EF908_05010, partial [Streptomyces sp. WAC04770]
AASDVYKRQNFTIFANAPEQSAMLATVATGIFILPYFLFSALAGQLAVADVILNRTESGRFPRSVCGVVTQRGQFSFVRGGKLPTPPANGQWKKALAVAQVAMKDQWDSPVPESRIGESRGFLRSRNVLDGRG